MGAKYPVSWLPRQTAIAVGVPGGAVHDRCGIDGLGENAGAIGDGQGGRLVEIVSLHMLIS